MCQLVHGTNRSLSWGLGRLRDISFLAQIDAPKDDPKPGDRLTNTVTSNLTV
jgi:hypothetical protein